MAELVGLDLLVLNFWVEFFVVSSFWLAGRSQIVYPRNDFYQEYDYFEKYFDNSSSAGQFEPDSFGTDSQTEIFQPQTQPVFIHLSDNTTKFTIQNCYISFKNPEISFILGTDEQIVSAMSTFSSASGACNKDEVYLEVSPTRPTNLTDSDAVLQNYTIHVQLLGDSWLVTTFRMVLRLGSDEVLVMNYHVENEETNDHCDGCIAFSRHSNYTKNDLKISMVPTERQIFTPELFDFRIKFDNFEISTLATEKLNGNGIAVVISILSVVLAVSGFTVLKFRLDLNVRAKLRSNPGVPIREEDEIGFTEEKITNKVERGDSKHEIGSSGMDEQTATTLNSSASCSS